MVPCNRCRRCKAGHTNFCEHYDQVGFTRGGGYGEYVVVPRHVVHRLPDSVSLGAAVLVEPASCVVRGLERGRPRPGETIGVIGIGTLGSLAVTLARLYAPGALVAYGLRPEELRFAERLGADASVHVGEEDAAAETRRIVGDGLDLVLETAGAPEAVELATRLIRPGGRVVLLGLAGEGRMLELPSDRITFGDMDVIGSFSYTTSDWSHVVDLLTRGLVDFDPLITHRFPAERFEDAFDVMDARAGWWRRCYSSTASPTALSSEAAVVSISVSIAGLGGFGVAVADTVEHGLVEAQRLLGEILRACERRAKHTAEQGADVRQELVVATLEDHLVEPNVGLDVRLHVGAGGLRHAREGRLELRDLVGPGARRCERRHGGLDQAPGLEDVR